MKEIKRMEINGEVYFVSFFTKIKLFFEKLIKKKVEIEKQIHFQEEPIPEPQQPQPKIPTPLQIFRETGGYGTGFDSYVNSYAEGAFCSDDDDWDVEEGTGILIRYLPGGVEKTYYHNKKDCLELCEYLLEQLHNRSKFFRGRELSKEWCEYYEEKLKEYINLLQ